MATRTQTYGYGVAAPKVPKPYTTTTYGGTAYQPQPAPYSSPGSQLRAGIGTGGAVKALGTPGVNATQVAAAPPPTDPNVYDINTDPALQAITALTGRSDADAQAAALKQEQGQLLGYGDPTLAAAVLGQSDPTVTAAGQNPTSTLAQLGQSRTRNLDTLTEDLNKQNLFYGGYRITQEQQAAQDYQNALALAASGVQGNLDTIQGNLGQALSANEAQRIAGMQAAYAANPAGTTGTTTPTPPPAPAAPASSMQWAIPTTFLSGAPIPTPGPNDVGQFGFGVTDTGAAAPMGSGTIGAPTSTVDPNVRRLAQALLAQGPSTRSIAQ